MIRVPDYFLDFECIADRCKHSCCRGWDIYIDSVSLKKYRTDMGECGWLANSLCTDGDGTKFARTADGSCVHLKDSGLCRMYSELGKESLCEICREHPRYYTVLGNYAEGGVSVCCEAAAELLLFGSGIPRFTDIDEQFTPGDKIPFEWLEEAISTREELYTLLYSGKAKDTLPRVLAHSTALTPERLLGILKEALGELDILPRSLKKELSEALKLPSRRILGTKALDAPLKRLTLYYLHRYYIEGAVTLDSAERSALAVALALLTGALAVYRGATDKEGIILASGDVSRTMEYCEENRDILLDMIYEANENYNF